MTYDKEVGTVAGLCLYNYIKQESNGSYGVSQLYHKMPLNNSLLNEKMCGDFKRGGRLCGSCEEGFQLSSYSYNMKCVQCSRSVFMNWMIYVCVAFLPLTGFFIFVLVFRISATSPKWDGYILLAQYMASPSNVRVFLLALEAKPILLYLAKFVMTLYGVWNLDFFRTLYPPICLDIDPFQVLVLDYVVAVYPLAVSYFGICVYTATCPWLYAANISLVSIQKMLHSNSKQSRYKGIYYRCFCKLLGSFLCEILSFNFQPAHSYKSLQCQRRKFRLLCLL